MASITDHAKRADSVRKKLQNNTSEIAATQSEMAKWPFFRDVTVGELTWDFKEKVIRFQGGTPLLLCDFETIRRHNKEMDTFREFAIKVLEKEFSDPIPEPIEEPAEEESEPVKVANVKK